MPYREEPRLFSDFELRQILEGNSQKSLGKIEQIDKEKFINNSDKQICEYIYEQSFVEEIILHTERQQVEQREIKIDVRNDKSRDVRDRSVPCLINGLEIIVEIPFTGDPFLFKSRPSRYNLNPPRAIIEERSEKSQGILRFSIEMPSDKILSPEEIKRKIDSRTASINSYINDIKTDVDNYNIQLKSHILQSVQARRKRLDASHKLIEALGIPIKQRPGAPDIKPLPIIKRSVPSLVSKPKDPPEPGIAEETYEAIQKTIRHEGRTFETTPKTYQKLDEEELRDIILAHLNGQFKGKATGEAFRKTGKTDICIEESNRAAFVVECKIWRGKKEAMDAIDQLLGYLTWRDCKAALVMFNKKNSGFKEIQEKVPNIIKGHPKFIKQVNCFEAGEWRFLMESAKDTDRRITVHVFLFDLFV